MNKLQAPGTYTLLDPASPEGAAEDAGLSPSDLCVGCAPLRVPVTEAVARRRAEYLGMLGLFGSMLSGVQMGISEHEELRRLPWGGATSSAAAHRLTCARRAAQNRACGLT